MAVDIFAAVRLRAVKERDYFAMALFALHAVPRPGLGTMAVDKFGRVYWDPEIIGDGKRWTVEQAAWVLIHEVGHWIRKHHERAEPLLKSAECVLCEHGLINWCEDAELNDDLVREGAKLPDDPVTPKSMIEQGLMPQGTPDHLLFEQYYELAKKEIQKHQQGGSGGGSGQSQQGQSSPGSNGKQGGKGSGQQPDPNGGSSGKGKKGSEQLCDQHNKLVRVMCGSAAHGVSQPYELPEPGTSDGKGDTAPGIRDAEGDLLRKQVARDIQQAANRQPGSVPAGWARWANRLLEPPVIPWERELAALIRNAVTMASGCVDFSYTKPSRRGTFNGVIMPAMRRPKPEATVVIDTSGSMGEHDLSAVLREIKGIIRAIGQQKIPIICCDAAAAPVQRVSSVFDIELIGGGGTDMGEGIRAAEKLGSKVIIVLTDSFTPWPSSAPNAQMVVGVVGREDENLDERLGTLPSYTKRALKIPTKATEC